MDFLNSGGQIKQLDSELKKINALYSIKDVTNDGIPDLTLISGSAFQIINIFYCDKGQYRLFPKGDIESESLGSESVKFEIQDINQNGIPEIISIGSGRIGLEINIFEWSGNSFTNLTDLGAWMPGLGVDDFQLVNLDGDNVPEFVLRGNPTDWYYPGEPLRHPIDFYQWNGKTYSPLTTFGSPEYRFQAIQDGDSFTTHGKYAEAMSFYKDAINSDVLDWWSKAKFEAIRDAAIISTTPTVLDPDSTEYPRLAAYAYYRILLLHLVQNQESEATTTYNTLQQEFSNDPYARPYMEMASVFWDAYQSTHKMYDGCAAAIQFAVEHPDILTPLGAFHHGGQSHFYEPEDVCPFR